MSRAAENLGIVIGCVDRSRAELQRYARERHGVTHFYVISNSPVGMFARRGIDRYVRDKLVTAAFDTNAPAVYVTGHAECVRNSVGDSTHIRQIQEVTEMVEDELFPFSSPVEGVYVSRQERIRESTIWVARRAPPTRTSIGQMIT